MSRSETLKVWSPELDDAVFRVKSDGTEWDEITTETDDYLGQQLSGSRTSFEFHFPTADTQAEEILQLVLEQSDFEYGSRMSNQYTVFDYEFDSVFTIGVESDTQLVIHSKDQTKSESIKKVYQHITDELDSRVQVIRYYQEF